MKLKTHDDRLTLTNGTYHSLVNARKPEGIEEKKALDKILVEASNLFIANVDFNRRAKILDLIKTAYAVLEYIGGTNLVVA